MIWTNENTVVMFLEGVKYRVTVDVEYDEYSAMPIEAKVKLEPSDEPVTASSNNTRDYYKFGGAQDFVQFPHYPVAKIDQKPYAYVCTVENSWGDCGNGNIFALIRNGAVEDVYVEASCA